jgi:hypothetical protein
MQFLILMISAKKTVSETATEEKFDHLHQVQI